MSDEAQQPPKSQEPQAPRTMQISTDPVLAAMQCKDAHVRTVGDMILGAIADAKGFLKTADITTASWLAEGFLTELMRTMQPRDGFEEMLVVQAAATHQRIMNLSLQASEQELTKNVAVINVAVDGACNVFRRQMLALAEYRRSTQPKAAAPGARKSVEDSQDEFGANELGSKVGTATLPALAGGIGVPSRVGTASTTVGVQHGSANGNGQITLEAQRDEARAIQLGPPRRTSPTVRVDPANARRRRRAQ